MTPPPDSPLSERERQIAQAQVDYFCDRYSIRPEDVPHLIEALKWLGAKRSAASKLAMAFWIAVAGTMGAWVWDTIRHLFTGR